MKYYLVNHFFLKEGFSNGVSNYITSINNMLNYETQQLAKTEGMSQEQFRRYLANEVSEHESNYIIEAAESQASTLYIQRDKPVHIRLHCPFHLYKRVIRETPDETRYSLELRAIYKAQATSSPSHTLLELSRNDLDEQGIHVFKNPYPIQPIAQKTASPQFDVIFLTRFNKLKGIEFVNPILRLLPRSYKVLLIGKQEEKLWIDPSIECTVLVKDQIPNDEINQYLRNAKVSISLSKFENCSMVALESIANHTPVVCWDSTGTFEIAPPPVVNAIQYGDVFAFAERVIEIVQGNRVPTVDDFSSCLENVNEDYRKGMEHLVRFINKTTSAVYKGIDFREAHRDFYQLPYELRGRSWNEFDSQPLSIAICLSSKHMWEQLKSTVKKSLVHYLIVAPFDIPEESSEHSIKLDWEKDPSHLNNILGKQQVDAIFYDSEEFAAHLTACNLNSRYKAICSILRYDSLDNNTYFDRLTTDNTSYLQHITINSPLALQKVTQKRSVLICCSAHGVLTEQKKILANIKKILMIAGVEFARLYGGSHALRYDLDDDFFVFSNWIEATDIILLDNSALCSALKSKARLYTLGGNILHNKNVSLDIKKSENLSLSIQNDTATRKYVIDFLKTKSVTSAKENCFWFLDEIRAIKSRINY